MRLLSFLTEIERALLAESPVVDGGAWDCTRMVNFHSQLARLTLRARAGAELPITGGTILLQSFSLADGSLCLKATMTWPDSEAQPMVPVYDVPGLNWKLAAAGIARVFLEGPSSASVTPLAPATDTELAPLVAVAS